MLVTCAYLTGEGAEWVRSRCSSPRSGRRATRARRRSRRSRTATRSASRRDALPRPPNGVPARLPRGVRVQSRCASQGRVELCRLELAGLAPVEEGRRAKRAARRAGGVQLPGAGARRVPAHRRQLVRRATASSGVSRSSPAAGRAGVGERARRAPAGTASRSRVGAERQPEHAEGRAVAHDAARPRQQSRVVALAAGADDERADPLERRKALVVVVVALRGRRRPSRAREGPRTARTRRRAVEARAEARVVPVGERAPCGCAARSAWSQRHCGEPRSQPPTLPQFEFSTTTCQAPSE